MDISVVVPVYGCPNAIPELHKRLGEVLKKMGISYEIILVDDHDQMGSWNEILKVAKEDTNVKAIKLAKNFGQGAAITAGIDKAVGDWIVTMDCDLQDSPEDIPLLYEKVCGGVDVVFVKRQKRKDSFLTQLLSRAFHKVFSYLSEMPYDYEFGTYLIASKRAVEYFRTAKDRGRDFTMYMMWLGLKCDFIELEHKWRYDGKSSYTFRKKWKYAIGVMTTFSNRILYIPIYVGTVTSMGAVIYILYILYSYFILHNNPVGWTALAAAVFFFGGLILSTLGIMGIYLGNVFDMNKSRPLYVIQTEVNTSDL